MRTFRTLRGQRRAGGVRATAAWALGIAAALVAWTSTFRVPEGEVAVVARFGDPRRLVEEPGLHFKWPAPVDSVYRVDMRRHVLDPPVSELLTADQKNVELDAFVAWRVAEPRQFLTSLRDRRGADDRLDGVLQSTLGEVIRQSPFEHLVGTGPRDRTLEDIRAELAEDVARRCRENGFGIAIELVGIERITFPETNKPAVERSMRVNREGIAAQHRADGAELAAKIDQEARAEESRMLAEAEEQELRIRGDAEAEAKAIERDMIAANPDLYWMLKQLDVAEVALQGQLLLLPSNHELTRVFDAVAPIEPRDTRAGGDE